MHVTESSQRPDRAEALEEAFHAQFSFSRFSGSKHHLLACWLMRLRVLGRLNWVFYKSVSRMPAGAGLSCGVAGELFRGSSRLLKDFISCTHELRVWFLAV